MWMIGDSKADIWNSIDGRLWRNVGQMPEGVARFAPMAWSYDGNIFIAGGLTDSTYPVDVWSTENGSDWTEVTSDAEWMGRREAIDWVYDDAMWIMNGQNATGSVPAHIYKSTDGETWTKTYAATGLGPTGASSCVHSDMLFYSGGFFSGLTYTGLVIYSADGTSITVGGKAHDAYWGRRSEHQMVSFGGDLYLIGGKQQTTFPNTEYKNDVWKSEDDGDTWANILDDAPWSARGRHAAWIFDDRIWIGGGQSGSTSYLNDIWYSEDGITWRQNV
jgi:N-acetylneuraminic acid mutarotase